MHGGLFKCRTEGRSYFECVVSRRSVAGRTESSPNIGKSTTAYGKGPFTTGLGQGQYRVARTNYQRSQSYEGPEKCQSNAELVGRARSLPRAVRPSCVLHGSTFVGR